MRTVTMTREYFTYDELSDDAKEAARDWWREGDLEYRWYEPTEEDFKTILEKLGFWNVETRFTGFWSQGDGASFTARYSYSKGAARALKEYAPQDAELHRIADELQALQKRNFYQLWADVSQWPSRYCHEMTMRADITRNDTQYREPTADAEDTFIELCRELARWYYSALESEYNYLMNDESVAETITANGYEFTADGSIA